MPNLIKTAKQSILLVDNYIDENIFLMMILLDKIEKCIQDADNGKVISEEYLEKKIKEWLK